LTSFHGILWGNVTGNVSGNVIAIIAEKKYNVNKQFPTTDQLFFLEGRCMGTKAKFHGSAFGGLDITEQLSDEQIDEWTQELFGQLTLAEKIKMMSGDLPFWPGMADMLGGGGCTAAGHPRCALRRWSARGDHGWWHHFPSLHGPRRHL
jgi:hypothetical protein